MKKPTRTLLIASSLTFFTISTLAAETQPVGGSQWKATMRAMLSDVVTLFPIAFDEKKFADPKNANVISGSLTSLAKRSAEIKKHTSLYTVSEGLKIDPSFSFIAEAFDREINMAQGAFQEGDSSRTQAQLSLRSALSKCVMCHTQSANGPNLHLDSFQDQLATLSSSDRFLALASTRQFDEALVQFDHIATSVKINNPEPGSFDRDAKAALAIAIRVKKDPARTMALINEITASKAGSTNLQFDAKGWKKSTQQWIDEKPAAPTTDEALFGNAKRLSLMSRNIRFSSGDYDNTDVSLLRATALLHDLLAKYPKSERRGESFLLLASIYESLPGFGMWDMGDEYLGACIVENPHSEMGERCFHEYDDSILMGYTGSSGTHIPSNVREHVNQMKLLAQRPKQNSKTLR